MATIFKRSDRVGRSTSLLSLFTVPVLTFAAITCWSSSSQAAASSKAGQQPGAKAGVAKAKAELQSEQTQFEAPGPPVAASPKLNGKTLWLVVSDASTPFAESVIIGMKQGASEVGMQVHVVDGQQSSATASTLVQQAVSQHAAAIVISDYSPEALATALKDAKTAHIPVISIASRGPGPLPASVKALGVNASVGFCYTCAGRILADTVVVNSRGHANIGIINTSDVQSSNSITNAFKKQINTLCRQCEVQVVNTNSATTLTKMTSLTSSLLIKNSGPFYIVPIFDYYVPTIASAISAADASQRTKILSWNGSLSALQLIKGGGVVLADASASPVQMGWATIDQIVRVTAGHAPSNDERIPIVTFTSRNIDKFDLSASPATWYDRSYEKTYKTLWGIK